MSWRDDLNGTLVSGELVDGFGVPLDPDERCVPETDLAICLDGLVTPPGGKALHRAFLEDGRFFWSAHPLRDAALLLIFAGVEPDREVEVFAKTTRAFVSNLATLATRSVSDTLEVRRVDLVDALNVGVPDAVLDRSGTYDPNTRFGGSYPLCRYAGDLSARGLHWRPLWWGRLDRVRRSVRFVRPSQVLPRYRRVQARTWAELDAMHQRRGDQRARLEVREPGPVLRIAPQLAAMSTTLIGARPPRRGRAALVEAPSRVSEG